MLLTGIFILFWLQYQFTISDNEAPGFERKQLSFKIISIKDSMLIKQNNLNSYKNGLSLLNDKGKHRLTFLSDQGGDTHTASQYFT